MTLGRLEYGVMKYGTPMYVFDIDKMRETTRGFQEVLQKRAHLCFAMKANPFLTAYMAEELERIEVCSMGEYQICRELGIPPEKLLISGVLKKPLEIEEILRECGGRCRYTVESLGQFYQFISWCDKQDEHIGVYLRLSSGNQFGMDEEAIDNIYRLQKMCPNIQILGLHYFSGTQKKSAKKIEAELKYLSQVCLDIEAKTACKVEELEYGPGLSMPYFEGQSDERREQLAVLAEALSQMKWQGAVTLEMGRALAADCGYYLTTVVDAKQTLDINYGIVDGGMHHLNYDGQIRGMYRPQMLISPARADAKEKKWTICGALCTASDVLVKDIMMQELTPGNVLIFKNTGAYSMTEGMALFLSHPLPKIAVCSSQSGWKLVRDTMPTFSYNMMRKEERENGEVI